MSVVSLPGALEHGLGVLPDGGDSALRIHDPHDSERADGDAGGGGHGVEALGGGRRVQVLFQTGDDKLEPGLSVIRSVVNFVK